MERKELLTDFSDILKRKFPFDARLDCYVVPHIPATMLSRAAMQLTRIPAPTDVIALHRISGTFTNDYIAFTGTVCYHAANSFRLEDVRDASADGRAISVVINQGGQSTTQRMKAASDEAARLLAGILDDLVYLKNQEQEADIPPADYSGFDPAAVPWLQIRDEVMKTIDQLYQRFQDGKLSLTEYEAKKFELLARL